MSLFGLLRRHAWLIGFGLSAAHAVTAASAGFVFEIAPGEFDEHCLRIDAGEAIRWRFVATGPVDFNIHAHRGDDVVYPVRRAGVARASGRFRTKATEDHCLMWTNPGAVPVGVRGAVEKP